MTTSMTIIVSGDLLDTMLDTSALDDRQAAIFLAGLAHGLTVSARITYVPGQPGLSDSELLRSFNEVQHRVTASLQSHLGGEPGMPVAAVVEMLLDFGRRNGISAHIDEAILCACKQLE